MTSKDNTSANASVVKLSPRSYWPVIVIVLIAAAVLRIVFVLPSRASQNDFAHYYLSSRLLIDGDDPYRTPLEPLYAAYGFVFDDRIPTATNPPPLLWLVAPFCLLSPGLAHWLWAGFNGLSLVVCLLLIRGMACADWSRKSWWFAVAAVCWSAPLFDHFAFSQVQLELAALLLGAFGLHQAERPGAGCVLVALAAAMKLFPVLMLPWFVFHSAIGWREVLRRLTIVGLVWLGIFAATGPALWQGFVQHGLPVISTGIMNQWGNQSLPSLILNVASASREFVLTSENSRLWWSVASLAGVVTVAGSYVLVWAKKGEPRVRFGVVLLAMVVSGTTAWTHYFVFLIWPALVAVDLAGEHPGIIRRALTGAMAILLVAPLGDLLVSSMVEPPVLVRILLGYLPLLGAAIAAGLLISSLRCDSTERAAVVSA